MESFESCSSTDSSNDDIRRKSLQKLESDFMRKLESIPDYNKGSPYQVTCAFLEKCDEFFQIAHEANDESDKLSRESKQDNSIKLSDEVEHSIQTVFATRMAMTPPGDTRLLQSILRLSQKLCSKETLKILLDVLPRVCSIAVQEPEHDKNKNDIKNDSDANATERNVISSMQAILDRSEPGFPLVMSVIDCLSSLELSEEGKQRVLEITIEAMPKLTDTDIPKCAQALFRNLSDSSDAKMALNALRKEHQIRQQDDTSLDLANPSIQIQTLNVVVEAFSSTIYYPLLAPEYFTILSQDLNKHKIYSTVMAIDIVIALIMQQDITYKETINNLLYSWLENYGCLFDALAVCVKILVSDDAQKTEGRESSPVNNFLPNSLIRLCLFLILSPTRANFSKETSSSIEEYSFALYKNLDISQRTVLIQGMIHLLESTARMSEKEWKGEENNSREPPMKRKRIVIVDNSRTKVVERILCILRKISMLDPEALTQFTLNLTRLLDNPLGASNEKGKNQTDDDRLGQNLCDILLSVYQSDRHHCNRDGNEPLMSNKLMQLLSEVLPSSSGMSDTLFLKRALYLATSVIPSRTFLPEEKRTIREWVLNLLLPSTPRVIDPEVGCLGLKFLKIWHQQDQSTDTFDAIKLMISRTGLVQKRQNNAHTAEREAGEYSNCMNDSELIKSQPDLYEIVFCIDYYVRNTNYLNDPSKWIQMSSWVFDLVDTYLGIGQGKSPWKADRWLNASFLFPALRISDDGSRKVQAAKSILKSRLCDFQTELMTPPKEDMDEIAEILSVLDLSQIKDIQSEVLRFEMSLLIAISLSAAVLTNVFAFLWANGYCSSKIVFDQIKCRLDAIYRLKDKCIMIQSFLSALTRILPRRRKTLKLNLMQQYSGLQTGKSVLEGMQKRDSLSKNGCFVSSFTRDAHHVARANFIIFSSDKFLNQNILWSCLLHEEMNDAIVEYTKYLEEDDLPKLEENLVDVTILLRMKCDLLQNLLSLNLGSPQSPVPDKTKFSFLLEGAFQTLDILPKIQVNMEELNLTQGDDVATFAHYMNSVCVLYLQLTTSLFNCTRECASKESLDSYFLWYEECLVHLPSCPSEARDNKGCSNQEAQSKNLLAPLADRLNKANNPMISLSLLELISLFVVKGANHTRGQAIALSWTSLHTIYATTTDIVDFSSIPFAFLETVQPLLDQRSPSSERTYHLIATDFSVLHEEDKTVELFYLRQNLLRHWGLLCVNSIDYVKLKSDFSLFISELISLLETLQEPPSSDDCSGIMESPSSGRKRKKLYNPSIVGLSQQTYPYFFEWMIHLLKLTFDLSTPNSSVVNMDSELGPYHHIEILFRLFHRLYQAYKRFWFIFPKQTPTKICTLTKEIISAMISLVYRFIDWRTAQPMIPVGRADDGMVDPGSQRFIQNLVHVISSQVLQSVVSVCEKWQEHGSKHRRSIASLRICIQNAENMLQQIGSLHVATNSSPSHKFLNEYHLNDPGVIPYASAARFQHDFPDSDDDSHGSSFCIHGNGWGGKSCDESVVSLDLQAKSPGL